MITEEKLLAEVKRLEKEVEGMEHPTKQGFLRLIKQFKINLEQPVDFEIPAFLRKE